MKFFLIISCILNIITSEERGIKMLDIKLIRENPEKVKQDKEVPVNKDASDEKK